MTTIAMNEHHDLTEQAYRAEQARIERDLRARRPAARPDPSLAAQVEAELRKPGNERVVAALDDTGGGSAVLVPEPYFTLSPARRADLEARRDALTAQLAAPGLHPVARIRLEQELHDIEHRLAMASGRR